MSEIDWMNPGIQAWKFKIANGSPASLLDLNYQAYIANTNNELVCGATILTSLIVLTAAHCFRGASASGLKLVAGDYRRSTRDGTEQIIPFDSLISHEGFSPDLPDHDIALGVLSRPLRFTTNVSSIAYPILPKSYAGNGLISGWGKTNDNNEHHEDILHQARIPILPLAECAKKWEIQNLALSDNFICAHKSGTDACFGDSGGPLTGKKGNNRQVIGVIAVGPECGGGEDLPGVYINVSRYGTWILRKILGVGPEPNRCEDGNFYCQSANKCIPSNYVCDGDNDCGTNEDERNCPICQKGKYRCPNSGKCIAASKYCDGSRDCPDGEDEADCSPCSGSDYRCQVDKRCIPHWSKCNWHEDCDGGDDEKDCPAKPVFTCNSGRKLPENWKCDGQSDCPGGEDEAGCSYKCNKACRPYQNNRFNEAIKQCCTSAGYSNGHCNRGDVAYCH